MSAPLTADELFAHLDAHGIEVSTVEHTPVFTVEEAQAHRGDLEGTHVKNLFLRNKKKRMWLVVVREDRRVDIKALAKRLGAGNLSFGRPERLMTYLGVEPGAVTPFAVINDREGEVKVVLDASIFDRDPIHCHPLRNDRTTALRGDDLMEFLRSVDHEPEVVDMSDLIRQTP